MTRDTFLPRLAERSLEAIIGFQPVAVLMGGRQTGKSTLVRHTPLLQGHQYLTLDDLDVRAQALEDPESLVRRGERLILDEVQRAPDLIIAIKAAVDRDRRPGRFVLTGSANLLAMKRVKESLTGRASFITLYPLTRRERLGLGTAGCWSELAATPSQEWGALLAAQAVPPADWRVVARQSGYPPAALGPGDPAALGSWIQGYLDSYLERDVAELSRLSRPLDLLRLMRTVAAGVGQLEHQVAWARTTALPTSTLSRWMDLLEVTYQVIRVPAYSVNRTKRLRKSTKVYWTDTAMALHLAGGGDPGGQHLENLILSDLMAWGAAQSPRPGVFHWQTVDQLEVDLVLELPDQRLLPIEVKAAARPGWSEVRGLRAFLDEYADRSIGGLVLHGGNEIYQLSERIVAAPWWRVV